MLALAIFTLHTYPWPPRERRCRNKVMSLKKKVYRLATGRYHPARSPSMSQTRLRLLANETSFPSHKQSGSHNVRYGRVPVKTKTQRGKIWPAPGWEPLRAPSGTTSARHGNDLVSVSKCVVRVVSCLLFARNGIDKFNQPLRAQGVEPFFLPL